MATMTRRNPLLAGILLILALIPAFSLEKPSVFLGTSGGIRYGEAHEFVYTGDKILSELVWDLKPAAELGLNLDLCWAEGLLIKSGLLFGIPQQTGTMTDSDYLNLLSDGTTYKTTFSSHDAYLEHSIDMSINAGWKFNLRILGPESRFPVSITPTLGFRYMNIKWSGQNGYLQHTSAVGGVYPAWDKDQPKTAAIGTVIDYQQQYWIPQAGITIVIPVGNRISVDLGAQGSPVVFCNGTDNHYPGTVYADYWDFTDAAYSTVYTDVLTYGILIEPDMAVRIIINERLSVLMDARWTYITNLRGDTFSRSSLGGSTTKYSEASGQGGGAAFKALAFKLGVTTRLR